MEARKERRFELRMSDVDLAQLRDLRYELGSAARRDGLRRPASYSEVVRIAVRALLLSMKKK